MTVTRRRFLSITAAGALAPRAALAERFHQRTGRALGAPTTLQLAGVSRAEADTIFASVEAELARLERIFSLYDPASQLSELNAAGALAHPAPELLEVLSLCDILNNATDGAFDPTIQPLWAHRAGLAPQKNAHDLIGWQGVSVQSTGILFDKPGMQLTLNGIAQGYITDRIAALLRARDLRHVMIDMGEVAVIGTKQNGTPWHAGVAAPDGKIVARISLSNRAMATSAPGALLLNEDDQTSHILDPRGTPPRCTLVSISAPSATLADGLSTAGCLMSKRHLIAALARYPATKLEVLL